MPVDLNEYGSYMHCKTVTLRNSEGKIVNRKYILTTPLPIDLCFVSTASFKYNEYQALLLAKFYENAYEFHDKLLCIKDNNEALEFVKERWAGDTMPTKNLKRSTMRMQGPYPILLSGVVFVLSCVTRNAFDALLYSGGEHIAKWWKPTAAYEGMYCYLEAHGKAGLDVWGPYYTAWRLQHPNAMLLQTYLGRTGLDSDIREVIVEKEDPNADTYTGFD